MAWSKDVTVGYQPGGGSDYPTSTTDPVDVTDTVTAVLTAGGSGGWGTQAWDTSPWGG